MSEQGSWNVCIAEMQKELATMQYKVNIGEEKVNQILRGHKWRMREMIVTSSWIIATSHR